MKLLSLVMNLFLATVLGASLAALPVPEEPRSAGVTKAPNKNYSVACPKARDHEPQHNTRVAEPYKALKPTLTPHVPVQLRPHSRLVLTDIEDRPFFDYFAWQTFVGLVWPADPDRRGVADPMVVTPEDFRSRNRPNTAGESVPVVWETFRRVQTALPNPAAGGKAPAAPPAWDTDKYARPFDLDRTSKTKGKHPTDLDEAFSSPLIDQNRQYVRYRLQLNEVMYEFIRHNAWYLKANLPKSPTPASLPPLPLAGQVTTHPQPQTTADKRRLTILLQPQTNTVVEQPVPGNSITIKSAWRIMITEKDSQQPWRRPDDLSRYFVSPATVTDAVTEESRTELVGLVGLHIVVKTPQFQQGIWASFEHVDNLKAPQGIRPSFNGTGQFYPQGFSYQPKKISKTQAASPEWLRTPVEVSRIYKIPDTPVVEALPHLPDGLSTQGLNKTYQRLLAGTVWQYYELVITQWPTDPTSFYARPFLFPRGLPLGTQIDPSQPQAVHDAFARANEEVLRAYPRWSGLPIPQVGALNTTMETYFQNPSDKLPLETTSCMGCHYGASDTDYSWVLKLRTWPQPYNQGRIHAEDSERAKTPANTE